MANLRSIAVNIQTGDRDGAGTDGDVYLGICRREFFCDTGANDFERGSSRRYVFGENANVLNASSNDPRRPQLLVEDVDRFPVYIRFDPKDRDDRWNLERAVVFLNGSIHPTHETLLRTSGGLWLGTRSGQHIYLEKHPD